MKAVLCARYGPSEVLELKQVEMPPVPDNQILIRVAATAVNSADWRLRKADPFGVRLFFGLTRPKRKILGGVLSGRVEAIGKDVKERTKGSCQRGFRGGRDGGNSACKTLWGPRHGCLQHGKPPNGKSVGGRPGNRLHQGRFY